MIKFTLKRKISGKAIRKDKREKELRPTKLYTDVDGNTYLQSVYKKHDNQGLYDRNNPQKRYTENPNFYEEEDRPKIGNRLSAIRVPRKKRKTAWKRFKKNFPYIEVTDTGGKVYVEQRRIEPYPLNPLPKKKI